jgi:hypothetical protein
MRTRAGLVLVAAALAAGCGGGGGGGSTTSSNPTTTTTNADAAAVLAAAPGKVKAANSSKFKLTIGVESEALTSKLEIPAEGEFDYANKTGRISMDYGDVLSAAGASGSGSMEILAIGNVYYMKFPLLSQSVGASTPWIKFDITKLDSLTGVDTSSLKTANQGDPSQTLVYLKGAGSVEAEGTESIGGVETTKYHAIIDLNKVADLAPPSQRAAVRSSVQTLETTYGITELPLDVWIDGQGLPRRMTYTITVTTQGQKVTTSLSMDLSDYGVKVDVKPPPASQVTDLASLSG